MKVVSIKSKIIYAILLIVFFGGLISFGGKDVAAQGSLLILSDNLFVALEPGGPTIFDRILMEQNPVWADFRQLDHGEMRSAGVIFHETAFGPELGTGVSPAVILVTYGVERNWELPANGDLVSEVDHIRAVLRQHESDWILGKVDQAQYQTMANGATYALYLYFNGDLSKLENWSLNFEALFEVSPIQTTVRASTFASTSSNVVMPFLQRPFDQLDYPFRHVTSFFDHHYPLYSDEGNRTDMTRFDGTSFDPIPGPDTCGTGGDLGSGNYCYSGHPAYDYSIFKGTPVKAAATGHIVACSSDLGALFVEHENGQITSYLHMNPLNIPNGILCAQVGEQKPYVEQGQIIGYVSNKGTGDVHLHFGVGYEATVLERQNIDPFGWWGNGTDPWDVYQGSVYNGLQSNWLWLGDEANDGYLTVDNMETQAQLFNPPSDGSDWNHLNAGYQNDAWWSHLTHQPSPTSVYWGIWGTNIEQSGMYEVQAYWPSDQNTQDYPVPAQKVTYTLYYHDTQGNVQSVRLYADQSRNANQFTTLCAVPYENQSGGCPQYPQIQFGAGPSVIILKDVSEEDVEGGKYMVFFDAIRWQQFTPSTPTPTITQTPTPTPTPLGCAHWDLASEFRPSPDQENPNRDSCNNPGVWEFKVSTGLTRDPPNYSMALNFTPNFQNLVDLNVWSGNPSFSWPFIGYNANNTMHLWPLHSIQVHPKYNQLAIIAWKSQINGYVSVTGEVIDTHVESGCGNGIEWYIDKESTNLAYGGFENGGRQFLVGGTNGTNLNAVPVNIDERLYLLIDPKGVDSCDTTQINLFIDTTSAPATPTPLNGPTSTVLPPNFTPPPTTPAIPTATPPTVQPTPTEDCWCTINFLGLRDRICGQATSSIKLAVPIQVLQATQQAVLDIQLFHRVEDEILSQTSQGQHYIDLYYGHGQEIIQILSNDSALKDEAVATLQLWEPNLQALVDGEGGSATITSGQVQAVQTFLDHLYTVGSPELRQTIDDERIVKPLEQTIGLPMNQASMYLVDHQGPPTATPTETSTPTLTPTNTATATFTPLPTATLTPTDIPANFVFANGFESATFSAWDWTTTDGGDLSVSAQAAAVGSYGMSAFFDDGNDLVVYDNTPNNEKHYSARFYFDPNSMQMISEEGFYLLGLTSDAVGWSACIYFEQQGEYYSLGLCGKNDAGTWLKSDATLITDDWQAVEIEWQAASAPTANDGYIKLWIGNQLVRTIENIDSDSQSITSTMWGPKADTFAASGTMYFDAFASYKGDHIGLDPNGPAVSPAPARPDLMFADNFESGDLSNWNLNLSMLDGGDLSASALAAHQSNFGLQALIDDLVKIKLLETSPVDETEYHARFYFHPNSISMSSGSSHFIFEGAKTSSSNDVFGLELFYESGAYKLRPRLLKDSYSNAYGSKYTLSNNWHVVEIEWHASTAPGANNGSLSLWIDDVLRGTISNVDNDTYRLDQVMLGVTEGVDSTTSGSMLFDQFESRRNTHIGP